MTIETITTVDASNPTEVQNWFDNNPLVIVKFMFCLGNIFYVVY